MLLESIKDIIKDDIERDEMLLSVCKLIAEDIPGCDWIGFYMIDPEKDDELVLGPYVGEPTEHVRIAVGKGICGQAVERGETILVDDVTKESNYLSCSVDVKSEIVVPIRKDCKIVAELDIDSQTESNFDAEHKELFENICEMLGGLF